MRDLIEVLHEKLVSSLEKVEKGCVSFHNPKKKRRGLCVSFRVRSHTVEFSFPKADGREAGSNATAGSFKSDSHGSHSFRADGEADFPSRGRLNSSVTRVNTDRSATTGRNL